MTSGSSSSSSSDSSDSARGPSSGLKPVPEWDALSVLIAKPEGRRARIWHGVRRLASALGLTLRKARGRSMSAICVLRGHHIVRMVTFDPRFNEFHQFYLSGYRCLNCRRVRLL